MCETMCESVFGNCYNSLSTFKARELSWMESEKSLRAELSIANAAKQKSEEKLHRLHADLEVVGSHVCDAFSSRCIYTCGLVSFLSVCCFVFSVMTWVRCVTVYTHQM